MATFSFRIVAKACMSDTLRLSAGSMTTALADGSEQGEGRESGGVWLITTFHESYLP